MVPAKAAEYSMTKDLQVQYSVDRDMRGVSDRREVYGRLAEDKDGSIRSEWEGPEDDEQ